jgi:hypothetical protein
MVAEELLALLALLLLVVLDVLVVLPGPAMGDAIPPVRELLAAAW